MSVVVVSSCTGRQALVSINSQIPLRKSLAFGLLFRTGGLEISGACKSMPFHS